MVQLTDELIERLDAEASRRQCSRSVLIREAIAEHLDRNSIADKERRYVASYSERPQSAGDVDAWGDLDHIAGSATRAAMADLDAAEAEQGTSW